MKNNWSLKPITSLKDELMSLNQPIIYMKYNSSCSWLLVEFGHNSCDINERILIKMSIPRHSRNYKGKIF